jgi:aminoglycoside phosphotransferase (APT) family kinase protein
MDLTANPPVWAPDWVVTPELARSLVDEVWPALRPVSASDIGAGWDNSAYLINGSLVFRFPRRAIAVPLMETEIGLLPWLAPQLPLRIPIPAYVGSPSQRYPCPFAGYRMIPGHTLLAAPLPDSDRMALARPLARFLATLHSISTDEAKTMGAPADTLERLNIAKRRPVTRARLDAIAAAGIRCDIARIEHLLDTLPVIERPTADTLVHGDLHSGQIVINEQRQIAGIIDWGDVHVGDPAVDLGGVQATLPRDCQEEFLQEYGPVDDVVWAAARGRAIWQTIALLAHSVDVDDAAAILEARSSLERLVK